MARIKITGHQGAMAAALTDVPAFPNCTFMLGFPEAIGDVAHSAWGDKIKPEWSEAAEGTWNCTGRWDGELSYTMELMPHEDVIVIRQTLTNESRRKWRHGIAFNCFNPSGAPSIRDHECVRHWARTGGEFKRLVQIPRRFGPRPTIQLYNVEGAPPGKDVPFVANFGATPDVTIEGWIAIRSRDGSRLVAVAARPCITVFQNMEYSCIHASAGFGALASGQTGEAVTRVYLTESSLEEWYRRMTKELAQ